MTRPSVDQINSKALHIGPGSRVWINTPSPLSSSDLEFDGAWIKPVTGTFFGLTRDTASVLIRYGIEPNLKEGDFAPRKSDLRRNQLSAEYSGTIVTIANTAGETVRQTLLGSSGNTVSATSAEHDSIPCTFICPNSFDNREDAEVSALIIHFNWAYSEEVNLQIPSNQQATIPVKIKGVLPDDDDVMVHWFHYDRLL